MKALPIVALVMGLVSGFALCDLPGANYKAPVVASVTTTSAMILPANPYRRSLICVREGGSGTVYLKTGSAHVGTEGVPLINGGVYEPWVPPTNAIFGKAASGTQTVTCIEGE